MAGREKNCKWYFADQPNGQEVGPNNAMEQSFKNHPYASLVRESIQNSLDAVLDESKPVLVKFSFMEMKGFDYPEFFELQIITMQKSLMNQCANCLRGIDIMITLALFA